MRFRSKGDLGPDIDAEVRIGDNHRPAPVKEVPMPTRRELANAIRALAMDAVQQANSGHPGAPMGMADIAEVLWRDFLKHNPANPRWWDRDRFVLSNGHASMLLYSLLHLTGYPLGDGRDQATSASSAARPPAIRSATCTLGIETTTGPLGQGFANAVGMALAEKLLAAALQPAGPCRSSITIPTCSCGDGCLMEGISHEACSLAGALKLGKLIVFYDDNGISIDGKVRGLVRRRHRRALRGLRLARAAQRRRPGRRGGRARRSPRPAPRPSGRR